MNKIASFFLDLKKNRYFIKQLVIRGLTSQYKKSRLGMFWSLAEPLFFMLVLYVVFGIGLRGGRNMDIPFICYLVSGMTALNFFTSLFTKGTVAIQGHQYLLKKLNFRMSLLPLAMVMTEFLDHLLFLIAAVIIFLVNGLYPNWYWFQLIYYMFALSMLLLGITWFTSAVGVFWPDLRHITSVIGRALFYFSPIIWVFESIPENLQRIVVWNPLYYIVTGYRNSLFYNVPFWQQWQMGLYYWGVTLLVLILGGFVFSRLRPQFSDYI